MQKPMAEGCDWSWQSDRQALLEKAARLVEDKKPHQIPSGHVVAAIGDIGAWVEYYSWHHAASITRLDYCERLQRISEAADLIANALTRRPQSIVPDTERAVREGLKWVIAQWVASEGGLQVTALRALARGIQVEIASRAGARGRSRRGHQDHH